MLLKNDYGKGDFGIATILGNWSEHYKSWKNLKFAPILIIKYEDLIMDTKKNFYLILDFLSNFMDIKIDEKKIINTIESCDFDRLSKKEKKEGFGEAVVSKIKNKKLNFFHLGKKNDLKNLLNPEIEKKIRESFQKDMKELGYI